MSVTPLPDPAPVSVVPDLYTVNRMQDGAEVRAELSFNDAQEECAILNAQSRQQVGLTAPAWNDRNELVQDAVPVYGSMYLGEICRYEVRSASGIVVLESGPSSVVPTAPGAAAQ